MLTFPVDPMRATLGSLPASDDLWSFEIKWDGYRTLAFVDDDRLRLQSSNLYDVTAKYPEIDGLPGAVNAASAILDGELVALDSRGLPSFELFQQRAVQVVFHAFDVLQIDGTDTIGLAYEQRRTLLTGVLDEGPNWKMPVHRVGDGAALLAATAEMGMEGVMAKRLGSTYVPGKRTRDWLKVKNRYRTEVVIGGYTPGSGNRSSTFGSLLVGVPEAEGRLRFAGGVGTGFTSTELDALMHRFSALRTSTCPFDPAPPREYSRHATWLRPELRATVEITEFTNTGLVRQSSFIELVE
jgi:bifunctional non-homologous end joining protein LigD